MKSGIGPQALLQEAQIPVRSSLQGVGQNMRDHVAVILRFVIHDPNKFVFLPDPTSDELQFDLSQPNNQDRFKFYVEREIIRVFAFLVSNVAKSRGEHGWPDTSIRPYDYEFDNITGQVTLTMLILGSRMKSVGSILLNTTAFLAGETDEDTKLAILDPNTFNQEEDLEVMLNGIKATLKIVEETTPFQSMKTVYDEGNAPSPCKLIQSRTDDYWKCIIRQWSFSFTHSVGTVKMGNVRLDPTAVVDSSLRVKGVRNLRVADASIMPVTPNVNINAAVMVIAEKLSKILLSQYSSSSRIVIHCRNCTIHEWE